MHKLRHGALPKIYDKFFQNTSSVHSYKTGFTDNQNDFIQRFLQILEKFFYFEQSL